MTAYNSSDWTLFNSHFKEGDDVVAIDGDDQFHWGKLESIIETGCTLSHRPGRVRKELKWDEIRFMAHDGFPVRKVLGASGSASIEKIDTTNTQKAIHQLLKSEFPHKTPTHGRFGDPFDFEAADTKIYNPGNSGPNYWARFWNELTGYFSNQHRELAYANEECLVLTSKDGAKAQLWDIPTIYFFEGRPT